MTRDEAVKEITSRFRERDDKGPVKALAEIAYNWHNDQVFALFKENLRLHAEIVELNKDKRDLMSHLGILVNKDADIYTLEDG